MDDEDDASQEEAELIARAPTLEDLVGLCRDLNAESAKYIVIGGFAMIQSGYPRTTMDIDLLIEVSLANETKVLRALGKLPDGAAKELVPGEVAAYTVVRVGDEFVVDLMKAACGLEYEEASSEIVFREINGVSIPFASPRLLWRTKFMTHREKDAGDLLFLKEHYGPEIFGSL